MGQADKTSAFSYCDRTAARLSGLYAITLPEPKPRVVGIHLVVLLVRSLAVGQPHGPRIRKNVDMLQPLYLDNGLFNIHGLRNFDAVAMAGIPETEWIHGWALLV
jgi:hypothetical protein